MAYTDSIIQEIASLRLGDGSSLAYRQQSGDAPTVVFLCGYRSDMSGTKASYLSTVCARTGQAYLRFDYSGHGASSGEFTDGTIGRWLEDTLSVLDAATEGPLLLVGSSMGGWIMSLVARRIPERIAGLIGVAAAPDFSEDLMWDRFDETQRRVLLQSGQLQVPSDYEGAPLTITRQFIDDGRRHRILDTGIEIDCPVHLIHGHQDPDVPWETAIRLAQAFRSPDVLVSLVKAGGHRLSEPHELDLIGSALVELLRRIKQRPIGSRVPAAGA